MNNIIATQHEVSAAVSLARDPRYVGRLIMLGHTELFVASVRNYPSLRVIGHDRVTWLSGCTWGSLRRYFGPDGVCTRHVNGEAITVQRLYLYAMGAMPWLKAQSPPDRREFKFHDIIDMFDSAD